MDKIDTKLLLALMKNARMPVTALAKRLAISREVATYRLKKLKREGIILDFVTEIDIGKLGYTGAAVFVNVKTRRESEFKQFLSTCGFVSWVAELAGVWSFGLSLYGKTNEELDEKFLILYNKFKEDITDHRFTLHRRSLYFYEKYFGIVLPLESIAQKKFKKYTIDQKDKMILQELVKNARVDSITLSKIIPLTAPAIRQRIKQLEQTGFIKKYSIFVDLSKLHLFQYSIFIINKNIDGRAKLLTYLSQHPKVSFIAEYVGDPFMEFGLIVENPHNLRVILQEIEESFPDNRIIEVSLFQKEFVSVGPPSCVFE